MQGWSCDLVYIRNTSETRDTKLNIAKYHWEHRPDIPPYDSYHTPQSALRPPPRTTTSTQYRGHRHIQRAPVCAYGPDQYSKAMVRSGEHIYLACRRATVGLRAPPSASSRGGSGCAKVPCTRSLARACPHISQRDTVLNCRMEEKSPCHRFQQSVWKFIGRLLSAS